MLEGAYNYLQIHSDISFFCQLFDFNLNLIVPNHIIIINLRKFWVVNFSNYLKRI